MPEGQACFGRWELRMPRLALINSGSFGAIGGVDVVQGVKVFKGASRVFAPFKFLNSRRPRPNCLGYNEHFLRF